LAFHPYVSREIPYLLRWNIELRLSQSDIDMVAREQVKSILTKEHLGKLEKSKQVLYL
jgi:hypothetical protein